MIYRREVDGLRAVAVVPVILFHSGFRAFAGGFVGVDVFFVISGYLITSVIIEDLQDGTFSLGRFYERRVRRIFPAFVLMLLVSAPLAALLLMPGYAKLVSHSLIAASLFASNLLYLRHTGYFGGPVQLRPLLHTWTLGVEEQYYLFFPLFMMSVWRLGRRWLTAILVLLVAISFGFAEWTAIHQPDWGFYLLPARGWELGLGALCALYLSLRPHADWNAAWRRALGLIGLGLIAYAALAFDENTPTPSSYTLLPTVGAALIILCASPANLAGKLLGSRVPVAIGLVSYSLYLWHQPIFVFGRHLSLLPPGNGVILIEYVALACVAWLSWRFVECPFRRKGRFTRKQVFAMAGAASVVLFTIGLIGHFTEGSFGIRRDFEAARRLDMRFAAQRGLGEACVDGLTSSAQCRTSDRPEILVWGDSFAMHLIPGLLASRPGARIEQATAYTCGPVLGLAPIGGSYQRDWAENCIRNNDRVLAHLKATPSIKYVLMGTIFSTYVDSDWGWRVMRRDGSVSRPGRDGLRYFLATIHEIRKLGGEPVLVSPPPQSGFDLAHCTELAAYRRLSGAPCDFPLAKAEQLQAGELALLHRLEHEARVIWLTAAICPNGVCQPRIDDTFIYADNAHLTAEGSTYLGRKLDFYGYLKRGENAGGGLPQP